VPDPPPIGGYNDIMNLQLREAGPERVVGVIEVGPHHLQPYGLVHGGVYCGLVETLASYGAALWAAEQGWFGAVGMSNSTDFIRATKQGSLVGTATPVHQGRSHQIWQVVVTQGDGGKVAARGQVRLHNVREAGSLGSP
jgi:1,4-dihydroxy-2-naphthoyl-CoA hydrolase